MPNLGEPLDGHRGRIRDLRDDLRGSLWDVDVTTSFYLRIRFSDGLKVSLWGSVWRTLNAKLR